MKRICLAAATFALLLDISCDAFEPAPTTASVSSPLRQAHDCGETIPLSQRFRGAERVVVASVERVSAAFGKNAYGDELIFSTVTLQIHERLRGDADRSTSFLLEGGTVGKIRLAVSDLPRLKPGDRGVFALRKSKLGRWVPQGRGAGILLLRADTDLEPIRRAERASR